MGKSYLRDAGCCGKAFASDILAEKNMDDDGDLALLRKLLVTVMDELDSIDEIKPPQAQFKLGDSGTKRLS